MEGSAGYWRNVLVLDFKSLYPSIIIGYGLCLLTYVPPEKEDMYRDLEAAGKVKLNQYDKHLFLDPESVGEPVLAYLEEFWGRRRAELKRAMKAAKDDAFKYGELDLAQLYVKILMNSLYGFLGTRNWLACKPIAETITFLGRHIIQTTKAALEKKGHTIIYGDTDSVMVKFPADWSVQKCFDVGHELETFVNNEVFGDKAALVIELECLYDPFIMFRDPKGHVCKKKYAVMSYDRPDSQPKLKTKGMVTKKRDNAQVLRGWMNHFLTRLMVDGVDDARTLLGELDVFLQAFTDGQTPLEDVATSVGISKNLDQYQNNEAIPMMARILNKFILAGRDLGGLHPYKARDRVHYIIMNTEKMHTGGLMHHARATPGFFASSKNSENAHPHGEILSKVLFGRDRKTLAGRVLPLQLVRVWGLEQYIDFAYYLNNKLQSSVVQLLQEVIPRHGVERAYTNAVRRLDGKHALARCCTGRAQNEFFKRKGSSGANTNTARKKKKKKQQPKHKGSFFSRR